MIHRFWSAWARWARVVLVAATLAVMAASAGFLWTASAGAQPACTDDYTGPSGGDWGNNLNWTAVPSGSHNVPSTSDVACVDSGTTVDVETGEGDDAESIQGGGNLTVAGGLLTLNGPDESNIGDLTITDGSLDVYTMTISGNFDWDVASGGDSDIGPGDGITQSGSGSFTIEGSGTESLGPPAGGPAITTSSPISITNTTGFGGEDAADPSIVTSSNVTWPPETGPATASGSVQPGST